jgi:hypothetical protein
MILVKNKIFLFITVLIVISCGGNSETKRVKYIFENSERICNAYYKDNKLLRIICPNERGDTIVNRIYSQHSDSSWFTSYYTSTNTVKDQGMLLGDNYLGKWESYFEDGKKQSVKHFRIRNDTSILEYVKNYNQNGNLESSILPVLTEVNTKEIYIDSTYELTISLKYSEFDTMKSIVFLDKNENIEYENDSLWSMTKVIVVNFTPRSKGELKISGLYGELGKRIVKELNIADRNFEKIIVVK